MRFKSKTTHGFTVFAVTGINTISFAIDFQNADVQGLIGFAIEREDIADNKRQFVNGFKVFKSLIPEPNANTSVSTLEHPMQSFVWDDFSAKAASSYNYYFYPMKGEPGNLQKTDVPIKIALTTEPVFSETGEHDVFFNRGTASSRAYTAKFGNQHPAILKEPKKSEALAWLSRDLSVALFKFIAQAKKGDALRCCFYEFSYVPVLKALKNAIDLGVDVQIILDMKKMETGPSAPRDESLEAIKKAGLPMTNIIERTANPKDIQHNKFMVFIDGATQKAKAVWTGSTNISLGGIHGHTNVGHWVRNEKAAANYVDYWNLLKNDPGGLATDTDDVKKKKMKDLQAAVEKIQKPFKPTEIDKIPHGITTLFSPMTDLTTLKLYAALMDNAKEFACITFPFGINKTMTDVFLDNTENNPLIFMLFDVQPKALSINTKNNVYVVWGVDTDDNLSNFATPTPKKRALLNTHVEFIHTKILLMDPLSNDPIVVSGSANFSNNAVTNNDENMLLIRGDKRAADIYLTEFNRLFNHFYMGIALKNMKEDEQKAAATASMFLDPTDSWLKKYEAGSLRLKRVKSFTSMAL